MMSLPKTVAKIGPQRSQGNHISFKGFDKNYPKINFIEFKPLCQKFFKFMSNFGLF